MLIDWQEGGRMPEEFMTIARFTLPLDAQMARSCLEAERIPAFVVGETTGGTLPGLGDHLGGFELRVYESDYERAGKVLAGFLGETPEDEFDDGALAGETWTCTTCGAEVVKDETVCPACATPTDAIQDRLAISELTATRGLAPDEAKDEEAVRANLPRSAPASPSSPVGESGSGLDADIEALRTAVGDDLAARACRAAIFGLIILPPLLHLYSLWLLARLAVYPGEVSAAGLRKTCAAIAIDVLALVFYPLFCLSLLVW
jgi:hypothetical protein